MSDLIVAAFITAEGVVQAPGSADDAVGERVAEAVAGADTFLLARRTWASHNDASEAMDGVLSGDEHCLRLSPLAPGSGRRVPPEGARLGLTLAEAAPLPAGVVYPRDRRAVA